MGVAVQRGRVEIALPCLCPVWFDFVLRFCETLTLGWGEGGGEKGVKAWGLWIIFDSRM